MNLWNASNGIYVNLCEFMESFANCILSNGQNANWRIANRFWVLINHDVVPWEFVPCENLWFVMWWNNSCVIYVEMFLRFLFYIYGVGGWLVFPCLSALRLWMFCIGCFPFRLFCSSDSFVTQLFFLFLSPDCLALLIRLTTLSSQGHI